MDALEKLKGIIKEEIYNEIIEELEEKEELESEKEELESEKEDLEYRVSYLESKEYDLNELNSKLSYCIDDYIQENYSDYKLVEITELNQLKQEHEKYKEGWEQWEDNKGEYEYLKKSKEWDNISNLTITNPPTDINQTSKDRFGDEYPVSYWVHYVSGMYGENIISKNVYRSTRSVSYIDEDEPYQLVENEDPEFKMIGKLKVFYNPWSKKDIKRIIYFSSLKKNVLNKYFNLLKKK